MGFSLADIQQIFVGLSHQPHLLFLAIILATIILEDPATIATGFLLSQGVIGWYFAISALFIGIFVGDVGLYFLGRGVKVGFFKSRHWSIRPTALDLMIARFVPGLRTITFSAAGFFEVRLAVFVAVALPSIFLWSAFLLTSSNYVIQKFAFLPGWAWPIVGVAIILFCHYTQKKIKQFVEDKRAKL